MWPTWQQDESPLKIALIKWTRNMSFGVRTSVAIVTIQEGGPHPTLTFKGNL